MSVHVARVHVLMIDAHTLPYMHIICAYICMVSVLTGRIPVSWLNVLVQLDSSEPWSVACCILAIIINYYYYYRIWFMFADDARANSSR